MKYFLPYSFIALICLFSSTSRAQKTLSLTSPNKEIVFTITGNASKSEYNVSFKKIPLIVHSPIGITTATEALGVSGNNWGKATRRSVDSSYTLIVRKASTVKDQYNELILPLNKNAVGSFSLHLIVRAYNDGIAFRYEVPRQAGVTEYEIVEENTGFHFAGDPTVQTLLWKTSINNHEGFYSTRPVSKLPTDSLMDMPALFTFNKNCYMAITEASLRNYAGMYLKKADAGLQTYLSPLPGQTKLKVKASLPHKSPWRVMIIGERPGVLVESNIITSLNEPAPTMDYSWVKPGKTSFHWWNGDVVPDTTFEAGANFMTNRYYIDFCARNGIEYHSVIGFGGQPWYVNEGGANYQPGYGTNITRTIPTIDMPAICAYAKSKGVGIHVWVHWYALYPKLDSAFALFEKWGINGMMVDFMDRDDQEMVRIQEEILQKAVKHKLYIQFHGSFKPTGLHRTYPSEFTREGTHNYEQNKWSPEPVSADHDINMVFTRLVAGVTDYHLGGFRAAPKGTWKTQFSRPLMDGTRAHMLGMYVVLESYLASLCDYPQAYEGQPGFDFLKTVPTSWDETKVPAASVGEYAVVARRKGQEWWLGSINNSTARLISVPINFLPEGDFEATIWEDTPSASTDPNALKKRTIRISNQEKLDMQLAASGGAVIHFKPL